MSTCAGNPEGHNWILIRRQSEPLFIYNTRRTLFKKRIVTKGTGPFNFVIVPNEVITSWYCSRCREPDFTTEKVGEGEQYYLDRGHKVTVKGKDIYPILTRKEYKNSLDKKESV